MAPADLDSGGASRAHGHEIDAGWAFSRGRARTEKGGSGGRPLSGPVGNAVPPDGLTAWMYPAVLPTLVPCRPRAHGLAFDSDGYPSLHARCQRSRAWSWSSRVSFLFILAVMLPRLSAPSKLAPDARLDMLGAQSREAGFGISA